MLNKILVICDGFLPPKVKVAGGKNLYLIQKYLSDKGFLLHFVLFLHKQTNEDWRQWVASEESKHNVKFHVFDIPLRGIYPLHLFLAKLSVFFIAWYLQLINNFNLVHEYSSTPLLVNRTYLLGRLTKVKTVHTLCTINNKIWGNGKLLLKRTDRIICSTKKMQNTLEERFKGQTNYIPIPIDDSFFNQVRAVKRGEFGIRTKQSVLFCGVLDERKGISCFLEAIPEIIRSNQDCGIVILTAPGTNTFPISRQNRNRVLSMVSNYEKKIIFMEQEIDMPALFASVDILAYPPLTMHGTLGSPSILIEGMASGKAIVASRLPEITEIIRDGENGLLFSPGDSQGLIMCVNKLLKNKELRHKLGEMAMQDSQQYRQPIICAKIMRVYKELLQCPF